MTPKPSSERPRAISFPSEIRARHSGAPQPAPAPLCSQPQRNNLAIELRSSPSIGSSIRQSTIPRGASLHVSNLTASREMKKKRNKIRELGLDRIFTINDLPPPIPDRLLKTRVCPGLEPWSGFEPGSDVGFQVVGIAGPKPSRGGEFDSTVKFPSRTGIGCNLHFPMASAKHPCGRSSTFLSLSTVRWLVGVGIMHECLCCQHAG